MTHPPFPIALTAPVVSIPRQRTASCPGHHAQAASGPRPTRDPVDLEIVIPAYNESSRLPATLTQLVDVLVTRRWTSRVVVVDNGSSDDTAAVVPTTAVLPGRPSGGSARVEVVVIGCAEPGKGAAVLRGLRTSRARWVGFADADLSTPVGTVVPAVAALEAGATAAIASRYAPGARLALPQPFGRRLGGTAFRALARPLVKGVYDTQCGFKLFDRVAAADAIWSCRSTGFAFDVELLHRVLAGGGRIAEIPVTWTDDPASTLRPVRDGVGAVLAVARMRHQRSSS